MKTNTMSRTQPQTHEGGKAVRITKLEELRRSVMSCMLWEEGFYEDGVEVADRIHKLCDELIKGGKAEDVRTVAHEARHEQGLRHVPLWIAVALAGHGELTKDLVADLCDRPDQMGELLSLYRKDNPEKPIPASMKKGMRTAFERFSVYQLKKYNRKGDLFSLRDVMFLTHPSPKVPEAEGAFKALADGTLGAADTWEVALSSGEDKKTAWSRLLSENKLGVLALLRNLRNMEQAGVDRKMIKDALRNADPRRIFPFQFISAAMAAPQFEPELEELMFKAAAEIPKLPGRTALVIDVSGSMTWGHVSGRSKMTYADAAQGTAMLAREICEEALVIPFGTSAELVAPRRGFALRDAIRAAHVGMGTNPKPGLDIAKHEGADRTIIFTDEQITGHLRAPVGKHGYCVNLASNKNGVGYRQWTHIDGFSAAFLKYIAQAEA